MFEAVLSGSGLALKALMIGVADTVASGSRGEGVSSYY